MRGKKHMGPQTQKEQGQRRKVRGARGSFWRGGEGGESKMCQLCEKWRPAGKSRA